MRNIYVTDTNSIISYFHRIFGVPRILSSRACRVIERALISSPSEVKLSIPSVVFIEIFDKWFVKEEIARKLQYEFFETIKKSPNIEVKPIDQEVLENILKIGDELSSHDMHDKVILASAIMLNCTLITTDVKIIKYVEQHEAISYIN